MAVHPETLFEALKTVYVPIFGVHNSLKPFVSEPDVKEIVEYIERHMANEGVDLPVVLGSSVGAIPIPKGMDPQTFQMMLVPMPSAILAPVVAAKGTTAAIARLSAKGPGSVSRGANAWRWVKLKTLALFSKLRGAVSQGKGVKQGFALAVLGAVAAIAPWYFGAEAIKHIADKLSKIHLGIDWTWLGVIALALVFFFSRKGKV